MKKNFFILVLAMFSMCTYANITLPGDGGEGDETPIHQVPHRSPAKKPSIIVTGDAVNETIYVTFANNLSNVTIEVYYEGVLINIIERTSVASGRTELIRANYGDGEYTIIVSSEDRTIIEESILF